MNKEDYKKIATQKIELNRGKELEALLKRVQADFDNYRKRIEQERTEIRKSANADLILQLLPVLDNFKRALAHRSPDTSRDGAEDAWRTGIRAIEKQFEDVLRSIGLEPIEVKTGEEIDPARHEVVSREQGDQKPGRILKEAQAGYLLSGKVLRPAKVVVADNEHQTQATS